MKHFLISFLSLAFTTGLAMGNDLSGKVINVIDGNTLQVLGTDGQTYNLMLAGVDCPELKQAYGKEAKVCLEKLTLGKQVYVRIVGKDRLDNSLAEVLVDGKKDPRIQLLRDGLAWTSEKDPNAILEAYRTSSQSKRKGIWKDEHPTPPWVFRREQSMLEAKSS
ncbi:MAG: thermonuclease family protein [Chryseolinea sp.]